MFRSNSFESQASCSNERYLFYKVWSKVFQNEKSDSLSHFSNFSTPGFSLEKGYFHRLTIFYKVWSKAFEGEEFDFPSHFSNFLTSEFSLSGSENRIFRRRKPFIELYKISLVCENNHLLMKIQGSKSSRSVSGNQIPQRRKPLLKLYKISLFWENNTPLMKIEGSHIFRYSRGNICKCKIAFESGLYASCRP
jgi:hypothetical protein